MTNVELKKERNNYTLERDLRAAQEIIKFSYETAPLSATVREEIQVLLWSSYYTYDSDDFVEVKVMLIAFEEANPCYPCKKELCDMVERLFYERHTI